MSLSRDSSFSLFVLAVNLQFAYSASRSFWSSHLLPFRPPQHCMHMHWSLELADHFLNSILTPSYTRGNYLILVLPHLRNFPPQNLQTAVERNMYKNFKALPKPSSISVPDLTPPRSLTSSSNGLTSAFSLLAAPIPFNGGDCIPMQAYYGL